LGNNNKTSMIKTKAGLRPNWYIDKENKGFRCKTCYSKYCQFVIHISMYYKPPIAYDRWIKKDMTNEEEQQEAKPGVVVKLFASSREHIGKDKITLKLTADKMTTVRDLTERILELYPSLSTNNQFVIAVNHKIADYTTTINQLDEVAILPPVSGG
jgi:molybdopterin synthase sulfur carrier subunit